MANERSTTRRVGGKGRPTSGGKKSGNFKKPIRPGGKPGDKEDVVKPFRADGGKSYRAEGGKSYREKKAAPFRDEGSRPDRTRRPRTGPRRDPNAPRPNKPKTGPIVTDGKIRLNKFLAECGIASRRAADEIIGEGEITINGKRVFELGIKINPKEDRVLYKGKPLTQQTQFVYYAFNKPKSVVTSTVDPQGRRTVLDYFPKSKFRLFPVGRLDWDSEGLLLITNDGEFANRVIHPDAHVPKTYHVKLNGIPNDMLLDRLKKGVPTIGGKVAALHVRRLPKSTDKKGWIEISIGEGKNHQIKNMFAKIGFDVIKLRRVAIGEFRLGNLQPGEHRELKFEDLDKIFEKRKTKETKTQKKDLPGEDTDPEDGDRHKTDAIQDSMNIGSYSDDGISND